MFLRFRRATPIANLVEGRVVVIKGTIVPGERIVVPHAGVSCVGFDLLEESFGTGPMIGPDAKGRAELLVVRHAAAGEGPKVS